MRLAIFGGTFDPIHNAHLEIARQAADHFHLDQVLFVPAAHPPHKGGVTHAPYEDRMRMAELACAGEPRFQVSRLEAGPERSYSIDTIEKVRGQMNADDELFFIIGADAFAELRTWRRWQDVVRAVCFLVVRRPGVSYEIPADLCAHRLDTLELRVSSSEVRRAVAIGDDSSEVPKRVMEYIAAHSLYTP